jgi:D-sedoheptulose 7-phosphate isomerase
MADDAKLHAQIVGAAIACSDSLSSGGKLLLIGNGGSAADAQHIAAEFVNYFNFMRPALAAIALTTDSSVLTSISNDSEYEQIFSRQLQALGRKGDVLLAYSTSGKSKNVIAGMHQAMEMGIKVVGLTGKEPGAMEEASDFLLQTPSRLTANIQEGHLVMGHILSGLVESIIFEAKER